MINTREEGGGPTGLTTDEWRRYLEEMYQRILDEYNRTHLNEGTGGVPGGSTLDQGWPSGGGQGQYSDPWGSMTNDTGPAGKNPQWVNPSYNPNPQTNKGATGGGGGGGGGTTTTTPPWEGTVAELLTKLQWPQSSSMLPPALRGWLGYMNQMFTQNPTFGVVPLPELVKGQPARFWTSDQERADLGQNVQNWYDTLQGLLGFAQKGISNPYASGQQTTELGNYSAADQWQHFLNAMRDANIDAQQQIIGLRYNPELANWDKRTSGWYTAAQPLIVNPEQL